MDEILEQLSILLSDSSLDEDLYTIYINFAVTAIKKYLGNDIEFSKVKNIKHIVYKDKYQIIVDTSLVAESEDDDTPRGMTATIIYEAVYDKEEIENE